MRLTNALYLCLMVLAFLSLNPILLGMFGLATLFMAASLLKL